MSASRQNSHRIEPCLACSSSSSHVMPSSSSSSSSLPDPSAEINHSDERYWEKCNTTFIIIVVGIILGVLIGIVRVGLRLLLKMKKLCNIVWMRKHHTSSSLESGSNSDTSSSSSSSESGCNHERSKWRRPAKYNELQSRCQERTIRRLRQRTSRRLNWSFAWWPSCWMGWKSWSKTNKQYYRPVEILGAFRVLDITGVQPLFDGLQRLHWYGIDLHNLCDKK